MERLRWEFLARLAVPTVLMIVGALYWASLLDARMREQNLILIQPVVVCMLAFYASIIVFEIRRYRRILERKHSENSAHGVVEAKQLYFIALAIAGAGAFWAFGAFVASVLILSGGMLLLGVRRPMIIVVVPLLTILVLWFVFVQGFGVRMPLFRLF